MRKKLKFLAWLLIIIWLSPAVSQAQAPWQKNKLREKKKWEKTLDKIEEIPVHEEKLKGNYQILGFVRGEDAFTNKKTGIIKHMRIQAYKMGADAIMEFKCKRGWKSLYQACEGFAIKFAESETNQESPETLLLKF